MTGKNFCLWPFLGLGLSPKAPFPSHPLNSCMGSQFYPPASHLKPLLFLITCLLHCYQIFTLFLWDFTNYSLPQPCAKSCLQPIKIGDQVLFYPSDQCPSPLSPKWQGPFKVILVTPTAAKLKGLSHWTHLSHLKPFTLPAQATHSYTVTQTGPCSLKFQRTPRSATLSPVPKK